MNIILLAGEPVETQSAPVVQIAKRGAIEEAIAGVPSPVWVILFAKFVLKLF